MSNSFSADFGHSNSDIQHNEPNNKQNTIYGSHDMCATTDPSGEPVLTNLPAGYSPHIKSLFPQTPPSSGNYTNIFTNQMAGAGIAASNSVETSSAAQTTGQQDSQFSHPDLVNGTAEYNNGQAVPAPSKESSSGFIILSVHHETKQKREKKISNSGFDHAAVLNKKSNLEGDINTEQLDEVSGPSAGEEEDETDDDDGEDSEDEEDEEPENHIPESVSPSAKIPTSYYSTMQTSSAPVQNVVFSQSGQSGWAPPGPYNQLNGAPPNSNLTFTSGPSQQAATNKVHTRLNGGSVPSQTLYQDGMSTIHTGTALTGGLPMPGVFRSNEEDTPTPVLTIEGSSATSPPTIDYPTEGINADEGGVYQPASRFRKARIQERIEHWREGRACFHDCRVKTVPTKVLDQLASKVEPSLPVNTVNRCPFCLGKLQEIPCNCNDVSSNGSDNGNCRPPQAELPPYVGAFWVLGKRSHIYSGAGGGTTSGLPTTLPPLQPPDPRLLEPGPMSSSSDHISKSVGSGESSDTTAALSAVGEQNPISALLKNTDKPTTRQSRAESGCRSREMTVSVPSQEENDLHTDTVPPSSKQLSEDGQRQPDMSCPEQPAPPTSPATGMTDRLMSPGSGVGKVPPTQRPVPVVPPASVNSQQIQPGVQPPPVSTTGPSTSMQQHQQPLMTSSQQFPTQNNHSRAHNIPTTGSNYQDLRPTQPNGSFESRIENQINSSLDVVRRALMSTIREEIDVMRMEINVLREQTRVQQETYERTFNFMRQYVPQEIWEQHPTGLAVPSLLANSQPHQQQQSAAPLPQLTNQHYIQSSNGSSIAPGGPSTVPLQIPPPQTGK